MHPYVPHLLEDIEKAHRLDTAETDPERTFELHIKEVERYLDGEEPEYSFGYHCGLHPENFPPAEQLTDEDILLINTAFQQMMYTWNFGIDLPKAMPPKIAYPFIVDCLNEKVDVINTMFTSIDFCSGYAPDCKLKEFCPCLEFWNKLPDENMDNLDLPTDELPF